MLGRQPPWSRDASPHRVQVMYGSRDIIAGAVVPTSGLPTDGYTGAAGGPSSREGGGRSLSKAAPPLELFWFRNLLTSIRTAGSPPACETNL
jgi:hypothetical protein